MTALSYSVGARMYNPEELAAEIVSTLSLGSKKERFFPEALKAIVKKHLPKLALVGAATLGAGLASKAGAEPLQNIDDFVPGVRTLSVLPKRKDTLENIDTLKGTDILPSRPVQPLISRPTVSKGGLENIDTLAPSTTLPPAPAPLSQNPGVVEKYWDLAKELGMDAALFAGSSAAAGAGAAALVAGGLVAGPVSALALPIAAGAGAIYTAAKAGQKLIEGKPQEETISETVTGQELPASVRPFAETAENILFFGGGAEALRLAKGPVKGLMKGVQKVSGGQTVGPIREAVWENVFVKPWSKGPLEAAAFGAGAGGLVGGVRSEDRLEGALTGAGVGALGMAGASAIAKMKGLTLKEALQPAIERLRAEQPNVERTFQKAKVQQALSREVFADAIKEAKSTLLPTELIEFQKGLARSIPFGSMTSSKAKDLVYRTERRLVQVTESPYRATLMGEVGKLMVKPIEEVESKYTSSSINRLFRLAEKPLVGKESVTEKEIRGTLVEVIRNPRVPLEVQQYAKDLYDFSAQAPLDVAKALTSSSNEYLISKLMKNPGVVSSVLKPNYVASTHPSIKGLYIHKDIELELEAMRRIPQIAKAWSNKWFMGPWKTNKVILRPATHFRNIFGNVFANDVFGGMNAFDPRNWKIYTDAASDLKNRGPNFQEFKKITGMTGRFSREEVDQVVYGLRYGATIFDKSLNLYDTIAAPARGMYAAEEAWAKIAKYMFNKKRGMKNIEAAYDAMRCTLNYSEVTPATAWIRTKAVPFFTWQSKIIPMTVEAAVKHPLRLGKWIALGLYLQNYALEQVGLSDGEWETIKNFMPEYMKKGMYLLMPWRDEKQQLKMLNLTWLVPGIGDISEAYQRGIQNPITLAMQHPLLSMFSTLASKKKFSGAPLYYDWESPATKYAKSAGAIWEMWSPAVMPGNIDWKTLQDAIQRQPEALSPEEAVASQFGFRLTSVDPTQMRRRSEALKRIHETEISTEMRKELKRARNPEQISEVLDKYRKLRLEQQEP